MGWRGVLKRLFNSGYDVRELARRLALMPQDLEEIEPAYEEFRIPKRSGGHRAIAAPEPSFREFQRRVLRRLLTRLSVHPAVHGFERGRSIVTNAEQHVGKAVVVRLDIRDFFPSTRSARVKAFFLRIGWNRQAAALLTSWCTWKGGLPQGAPTSPRLANLVNRRLDARLANLAARMGADYTRYADDLTFSWVEEGRAEVSRLLVFVKMIVEEEGYVIHTRRKLRIMRRHDRQLVTGLVVNERVALPRATRRWLRAVDHRMRTGGDPTLTTEQLEGWRAFERMVAKHRKPEV